MRARLLVLFFALLALASCGQPRHMRQNYILTTPQRPAPVRQQTTIVVDAGHGGADLGTHSTKNNYQEKNLCLATSIWLQQQLQQMGYRVIMTRTDDTFIPLPRRSQMANEAKADLFVSVHYNASHNPSARGIEVFYYPPHAPHDATRSRASKSLAQTVLSSLLKTTSASSRGIKDANYAVLRQTQMPAILVEGGFLSNPDEKAQLLDPVYLKSIALAIAQGIDQYVQQVRS